MAHEIFETAQSPNSAFLFLFDFGLGLGTWTLACQIFNFVFKASFPLLLILLTEEHVSRLSNFRRLIWQIFCLGQKHASGRLSVKEGRALYKSYKTISE